MGKGVEGFQTMTLTESVPIVLITPTFPSYISKPVMRMAAAMNVSSTPLVDAHHKYRENSIMDQVSAVVEQSRLSLVHPVESHRRDVTVSSHQT